MKKTKFYNEELTQTRVTNNILRVYQKASILDLSRDWYMEAFSFAENVANDFNRVCLYDFDKVTTEQVCGIIAALSPMMQWQRNKDLTVEFFDIIRRGKNPVDHLGCLSLSKRKAYSIYMIGSTYPKEKNNPELITAILSGSKISAFFDNILNFSTSERVTIDRHALSILLGFKLTQEHFQNHKMTKNHYQFFSSCYVKAAQKMNVSPPKMQAVTWETLRADYTNALKTSHNLLNLK